MARVRRAISPRSDGQTHFSRHEDRFTLCPTSKLALGAGVSESTIGNRNSRFTPWCPRRESNPHRAFRKRLFYPLNYGDPDGDWFGG